MCLCRWRCRSTHWRHCESWCVNVCRHLWFKVWRQTSAAVCWWREWFHNLNQILNMNGESLPNFSLHDPLLLGLRVRCHQKTEAGSETLGRQCHFSGSPVLPVEEQAASAEPVLRLSTSGQACQSARQGSEGKRAGSSQQEKGQPACPWPGSVQLSEPLSPTESYPHSASTTSSLAQGNSRKLRGERIPLQPCSSLLLGQSERMSLGTHFQSF